MGSVVLLDLMGGVALLLWGLHMVHSGILRAFGPDLRSLLAGALKNRFSAFAAGFVDRILRGAKPADMPVEEPTNFELALNVKAAREQGIKLPQSVLVRATKVVE